MPHFKFKNKTRRTILGIDKDLCTMNCSVTIKHSMYNFTFNKCNCSTKWFNKCIQVADLKFFSIMTTRVLTSLTWPKQQFICLVGKCCHILRTLQIWCLSDCHLFRSVSSGLYSILFNNDVNLGTWLDKFLNNKFKIKKTKRT